MTTSLNNLLNTSEFERLEWDYEHFLWCEHNRIKFLLSNNGKWLNLTRFKTSVDEACYTANNGSKSFLSSPNFGEYEWNYKQYVKTINGEVWIHIDLFFDIAPHCFKRFTAYSAWRRGEMDWQSHLFEFIYIRCDPKFKLVDWIIKGGREFNPPGRETNYWQHAVEGGCGTIYALFCVMYGSPAEKLLKAVFAEYFQKAPSKVDGKKTGTEYYLVQDVADKVSFENKILEAAIEFSERIEKEGELIAEWYKGINTDKTPRQFILKYMPWLGKKLTSDEFGM